MIASDIITEFELQVSDLTELSAAEELLILNRVYIRICSDRPWEFLNKNISGTILTDLIGSYIPLPDDFGYFSENNSYTDNTMEVWNNAAPKVIFLGSNYSPVQIVNWSDRRQYRTSGNVAYLSLSESKIRFPVAPTLTTYDFDYSFIPEALEADDEPVFPDRFKDAIIYGMAVEDSILQLSDKAKSYAPENQGKYQRSFDDMAFWNANLALNN